MTTAPAPLHEQSLVEGQNETTHWAFAQARLQNLAPGQTSWLATVRPDGRPHLMPIIALWIDGAFHFVTGKETQKGRNLAAEERCVIATGDATLPSLDVVVEGRAERLEDEAAVRHIAKILSGNNWPLEVRGNQVYGPHAPTAGPPPYSIYRLVATQAFGLPGMTGMDKSDPDDLPKPTRWEFRGD